VAVFSNAAFNSMENILFLRSSQSLSS